MHINVKHRKQIALRLACVLTALVTGLCMTQSVFAKQSVMPEESAKIWSEINAKRAETAQTSANGRLERAWKKSVRSVDVSEPQYYLNNLGCVGRPVDQGPWGTCWAYGAIEAAETNLLLKKNAGKTADMSEPVLDGLPVFSPISYLALPYFAYRRQTEDSAGAQAGEGGWSNQIKFPYQALGLGGSLNGAASVLANEQCFVSDKVAPYRYQYGGETIYMNDPRVALDESYTEAKFLPPFWRSKAKEYDWSLADPLRTKNGGGYYLSEYAACGETPQSAAGIREIKQDLTTKGGVAISYAADQSLSAESLQKYTGAGKYFTYTLPTATSERPADYPVWCQYNDGSVEKDIIDDHVAVIVGWNDHYAKENFQGSTGGSPEKDGAWLVKNSWGCYDFFNDMDGTSVPKATSYANWGLPCQTEVTDAEGNTTTQDVHSGFFWLSYYDSSIMGPATFDIEKKDTAHKDLYQHDYLGFTSMAAFDPVEMIDKDASSGSVANVFTAGSTTKLNSVVTYTDHANTRVNIGVYLMDSDDKTPGDGTKVHSQSAYVTNAGYHDIKLSKAVNLLKGQRFAVEIEEPVYDSAGRVSSYLVVVEEGLSKELSDAYGIARFDAVLNRGETYLRLDNKWYDFLDQRDRIEEANGCVGGNAMAKAYTGGSVSKSYRGAIVRLVNSRSRQLKKSGTFLLETSKGGKIRTFTGSKFTVTPQARALKKYLPTAPGKSVTFRLKETKAPKGYKRNRTVRKVTLTRSDTPGKIAYTVKISGKSSVKIKHRKK